MDVWFAHYSSLNLCCYRTQFQHVSFFCIWFSTRKWWNYLKNIIHKHRSNYVSVWLMLDRLLLRSFQVPPFVPRWSEQLSLTRSCLTWSATKSSRNRSSGRVVTFSKARNPHRSARLSALRGNETRRERDTATPVPSSAPDRGDTEWI